METTENKQNYQHTRQSNQQSQPKEQQASAAGQPNPWEQLAGELPKDKEAIKEWSKLLSNPFICVIAIIAAAYFFYTRKKAPTTSSPPDYEQLRADLTHLKKKNKKLRKQLMYHQATGKNPAREAIMD